MIDTSLITDNAGHLDTEMIARIIALGGVFIISVMAIVANAMRRSSQTRAKEESRREIAAYVAEGSMTADDAVALLASQDRSCSWGCSGGAARKPKA